MRILITRAEATEKGLTRFFTGVPCKHGHISERSTINGCCCECNRIRSKELMAKRNATPEGRAKKRESDRKRRADPVKRAQNNEACRLIRRRTYATEEGKRKHRAWLESESGRASANASNAKRRASIKSQTPVWVSDEELKEIKKLYKEAARLSRETGVKHHVDHIIPLQGELVCGFHCLDNLQILTESENCSKNNRFDPVAA
jgi:flagellum-specific peptidoglycan hydrolase FlgJ